jgi:hypothetical protein
MTAKSMSARFRVGRSVTGLGLFATEPFKRSELIAEYVGERINNREAEERWSKYLFEISSRTTIDGAARKNIARYINHSCQPNAYAEIVRGRVFIRANRRIQPGDEITYNYGRNYFRSIIEPMGCRCAGCATGRRRRHSKAARFALKRRRGRG